MGEGLCILGWGTTGLKVQWCTFAQSCFFHGLLFLHGHPLPSYLHEQVYKPGCRNSAFFILDFAVLRGTENLQTMFAVDQVRPGPIHVQTWLSGTETAVGTGLHC